MDETAIAFAPPHVRAAQAGTAAGTPPPLDRISVRDYTRSVEIGAYAVERGAPQRVRFNVVLEVAHHAAAEDDDVDQVISYDTITEAIEAEMARERINLLETLAERVARRVLGDPRAVRAFVRVEKLDRIPGALGVEIVRSRAEGLAHLRPAPPAAPAFPRPLVVHLPNAVLHGPLAAAWRDALARLGGAVLCLDPAGGEVRAAGEAMLRIGLLRVEENAWMLAAQDARFSVAASRSELDWAVRQGRPTVWAPSKLLIDAAERPALDASRPAALAEWLAREIGAARLVLVGGAAASRPGEPGARVPSLPVAADAPERLAEAAAEALTQP